jgi:hypothetical protein
MFNNANKIPAAKSDIGRIAGLFRSLNVAIMLNLCERLLSTKKRFDRSKVA